MASSQLEDAKMARKRHTAEEIVSKLRQVDVLTAQGRPVAEAVRAIGVSEVTYYRWRAEYGGLKGDQIKRLRELEAENTRLRRAVSDLMLDKMILAVAGPHRVVRVECQLHALLDLPPSLVRLLGISPGLVSLAGEGLGGQVSQSRMR